jgi:replicative DNA helicase
VKERASGRKTILLGPKRPDPDNVNDTTSHGHLKESEQTDRTRCFKKIGYILPSNIQEIENACTRVYHPTGILSGFHDLDRLTNGFEPCDFIVVAGGPGMGKTSICLDIARNVALNDNKSVGFFSFEMSTEQLITRMISALSEVEHSKIRAGMLKEGEWKRIGFAATSPSTASIYFDDSYGLTVSEVGDRAWDLKKECGLDLLFVDYIQLMLGNAGERKEQTISNISASLKALAKELNIPVIAVSQLNRFARRRSGRRPTLIALDEFPGLMQDADLILFIYRDDVHNSCSDKKGTADIIVGKNRNGPWGATYLAFLDKYATFRNIYTE